jgi:hypothetical protein
MQSSSDDAVVWLGTGVRKGHTMQPQVNTPNPRKYKETGGTTAGTVRRVRHTYARATYLGCVSLKPPQCPLPRSAACQTHPGATDQGHRQM